ncbi:MAG: ubiquinol-cytochrome c reductase iron-sulfur subunit [Desulfuromonadales bacterium]|nr:ubiquinol-cytochrome c reductase iron-sulfur subunit [Desulfuromonadales bacterium]
MEEPLPTQQRRRFLQMILGALGVALAALFGWPIFRFLLPPGGDDGGGAISLPRDIVAVGKAHFFDFQGRPAVLIAPAAGEYLALSAVCTHLGCIVKWVADQDEFLCPCHGGRFAPDGRVLGGPPPKALESYVVTVDGDQLLVSQKKVV